MNVFPGTSIVASQRMILDMPVCDFGWADAFAFADEVASLPIGQTVISFLNANNANLMLHDPEYRAVLTRHIVMPDGHDEPGSIRTWSAHPPRPSSMPDSTDYG